jgi:hypothetical protein
MDNVPSFVSSYFTKWSANIIEHVSTIGNQICLSDLTIQHLASFYGHRGGKGNLGKEETADHRANISMALSGKEKLTGKVFSGRPVEDDKWRDNLASAKTFIDTKERMPNQRSGDAEERRLGKWIANNKIRKEEPTANVKS